MKPVVPSTVRAAEHGSRNRPQSKVCGVQAKSRRRPRQCAMRGFCTQIYFSQIISNQQVNSYKFIAKGRGKSKSITKTTANVTEEFGSEGSSCASLISPRTFDSVTV